MVQVIKPQIITERIQTTHGEITVNLNLRITLNQDGSFGVETTPQQTAKKQQIEDDVKSQEFLIPDFSSPTELLSDFGEDVSR